jgi:GNAT superfamily N-acetyltransferase
MVSVRRVGPDEYPAIAAIVNAVTPDSPTSADELAWHEATYPGAARLLAEESGRAVGAATAGRITMFESDFDAFWMSIEVLPDARRRGVGSALYAAASDVARAAGKVALHAPASAARPEGIAFLRHRGFTEYDRYKMLALELAGATPPAVDPPAGISIVSLADRPDLVPAVHAVAVETFPDIPTGGEPVAAASLAEFRARDVDRPSIPPGGFAIALDETSGRVVGYASLVFLPASTTVAYNDMTAVSRPFRGRGIAVALKRALVAWAIGAGLERIETGNDPANEPMRAINARLGYRPLTDQVTYRGPLAPVAAGAAR